MGVKSVNARHNLSRRCSAARRSIIRRTVLYLLLLGLTIAAAVTAAQQTARVGIRLIAVKTEKEAAGLRARLQTGEVFADLAKEYSTAPSAPDGGWLGLFVVANLRKEFQEALEGLVPGQVSPIVKLDE